jgi:drug/metabolite transporter (DMT)-like permease
MLDFIIAPPVVPQWNDLLLILCLGIAALLGQVFLTRAFSHQNTGLIGAVGYSNIVFSIFFGVMIGDAMPDTTSLIGIVLIILSGVVISMQK